VGEQGLPGKSVKVRDILFCGLVGADPVFISAAHPGNTSGQVAVGRVPDDETEKVGSLQVVPNVMDDNIFIWKKIRNGVRKSRSDKNLKIGKKFTYWRLLRQ
jgi:hypothetical protein